MKKVFKGILIGLVVVLVLAFLGLTYYTGKQVFNGVFNPVSRQETVKNMAYYQEEYDIFEKRHQINKISIESSKFDHQIPALLIEENDNKNMAVLIHGIGGTKESVSHIAEMFLDLGYNILAYDQRNSGENMADYVTFGVLESYDALDCLAYAKDQAGEGAKIALFGESLGGSTALIAAGRDDSNIDYLILDSPVADSYEFVDENFKKVEKEYGMPISYMKFAGDIYTKLKLGFTLDDLNSASYVKGKKLSEPVLIMNSNADQVTPYYMGKEIYDSISADKKELHTEENYEHLKFAIEDPLKYKEVIKDFIE